MTRERGSLHGVPGVESDPEIQGGAPCIAGTRIPVALALTCLAALIEDGRPAPLGRLADQYPSLTRNAVDAALRYAARATERDDIATVTELRRRVQAAESAARYSVDEARRSGVSLGRGLANWAARDAERRAAAVAERVDGMRDAGELLRAALLDLVFKHPDASKAEGGLEQRIREALDAWAKASAETETA